MWNQAHNAYLESRILTADPLELVRLMYQAAIGEVRGARLHLANRDIRARALAVSKACAILTELTVALDRKAGGEYSQRLADLYGYMMGKLTEANFQQRDEPMVEVLGLLTTLLEGWEGAQRLLDAEPAQRVSETKPAQVLEARAAQQASAAVWAHAQESGYTPHAWSF